MKQILLFFLLILLREIKSTSLPAFPLTAATYTRDPARTPKNANLSDPVNTVDGSSGKYRDKHKHPNGKNWARRKKHADTVKPKRNKEKIKPKGSETN